MTYEGAHSVIGPLMKDLGADQGAQLLLEFLGAVGPQQRQQHVVEFPADRRRKLLQNLLRGERPYMLYIAFVILLVVFSLSSPWFLSVENFLNIGRQTTLVSIIAVGITFIIIARQIDLSVASTLALSGMAAAL